MLKIVERAGLTDVGRQRSSNEDSYLEAAPVFAVADGMGGARAGEVASRLAVEAFAEHLDAGRSPESQLEGVATEANRKIYRLAQDEESYAGMGTTLTAAMLSGDEVVIGHVGDSRLYRLRGEDLERLTRDHSLVEELVRQGKLSPEEAETHPQRSIITRALGPEPDVEVDTFTARGRDGDVYMLCSDGLTGMVAEEELAVILRGSSTLERAAKRLVDAANAAGGRDNITVVLFRVGDEESGREDSDTLSGQETRVGALTGEQVRAAMEESGQAPGPAGANKAANATMTLPPPSAEGTRAPAGRFPTSRSDEGGDASFRRPVLQRGARRPRRLVAAFVALITLGAVLAGLYAGSRQFYFLGTDDRGLVTLYRGFPYDLALGLDLYTRETTTSVPARSLPGPQRGRVLDHQLRSRGDAIDLMRELERFRGDR